MGMSVSSTVIKFSTQVSRFAFSGLHRNRSRTQILSYNNEANVLEAKILLVYSYKVVLQRCYRFLALLQQPFVISSELEGRVFNAVDDSRGL